MAATRRRRGPAPAGGTRPAGGAGATSRSPMPDGERVLEAAIELAREIGWANLRLRQVAARLDMTLADLHGLYRDQDALADAWFRRAERAMLAPAGDGYADLPPAERVTRALERWFAAVDRERQISLDMIGTKLYLSHPHHWLPMVFHLSRLIQWLREVARLDAGGRRRQIEEIGLTALFLRALWVWHWERSGTRAATRRCIESSAAGLFRVLGSRG